MMDILEDIRVLSFNHFLLGPMGTQVLADLGADVIGIEPVTGAFQRNWGGVGSHKVNGETMLHLCGSRNKRSLAIDMKSPEGAAVIEKLVRTADVMSENFRPGVMDKLVTCAARNRKFAAYYNSFVSKTEIMYHGRHSVACQQCPRGA